MRFECFNFFSSSGFANIPITITTRKTLIKKLRLAGSTLQKSKDLVTKYSSDEENTKLGPEKLSQRQKKSISSSYLRPTQLVFPPPPPAFSSSNAIKKIGSNTKNIYVSPVYVNDSDEEDNILSKNITLGQKKSPSKTPNREQKHDSISSGIIDLDATSSYTKRLLQVRSYNRIKFYILYSYCLF